MRAFLVLTAILLLATSALDTVGQSTGPSLIDIEKVRLGLEYIKATEPETIAEQIRITEIPAPPFKEARRAEYFRKKFQELGLKNVRIDEVGNVIGERPGTGGSAAPTMVLAAHLDTVFDDEVVKVTREGNLIKGLGIGDDGRGLTLLITMVRTLNELKIDTVGNLIVVANVGEEGLGDLRGTRHLFAKELKGKVTHFISIDGTGLGITNGAVGSYRYRVTFKGPGGHSYGAFGMPNPIHALGRAIEKISKFQVPTDPKTTFNVGRIEGGTSVNSIAHTASFEIDMRSVSKAELEKMDASFKKAVQVSLNEENGRWTSPRKITVDMSQVGSRPTGEQKADALIVRAALEADKALGIKSELDAGSTDSNIPISLGIPAITIDGGGLGRGAHSPDESWDATDSHLGSQRAFLAILGILGVDGRSPK